MNLIKILSGVLVISFLGGCAIANEQHTNRTSTTTIGQELIDLQKAKNSNVITSEEFEKAKKSLLKSASTDVNIKL